MFVKKEYSVTVHFSVEEYLLPVRYGSVVLIDYHVLQHIFFHNLVF